MTDRASLLARSLALIVLALPAALGAQTGTLAVVNKGGASVSLLDLASGAAVATLPTGTGPHEIALTSDGRVAIVSNYGTREANHTLTVIDLPGRAVVRTIDLGAYTRPHGLAVLPGDTLVLVTSEDRQAVLVVRLADGHIVRALSTEQGGSHMVAVCADATRAFTGNVQDASVSELDLESGALRRIFTVPELPEAIAVTRDGREVWVGSNREGTVSVLDPLTGAVARVAGDFGWPYRILFLDDERTVVIPDTRKDLLRVFDRATRQEREPLALEYGPGPQGLAATPDGRYLFVSLSRRDKVAVIERARGEVRQEIATGPGPDGVAYSPIVLRD